MTNAAAFTWETAGVETEVLSDSDREASASETLTTQLPIGKMLATVVESTPVSKTILGNNVFVANLKFRIDHVFMLEKPVLDEAGKPVSQKGAILMEMVRLTEDEAAIVDKAHAGRFIYDEISLPTPTEKEFFRRRRLFVANRLGLITGNTAALTSKSWGYDVIGKSVVLTTELNEWTDKKGVLQQNVRVARDGYAYPELAQAESSDDWSQI